MVRRPNSYDAARRAMDQARQVLASVGMMKGQTRVYKTECEDRPVPFTEVRQSAINAARLCGRGTAAPCPLLELCATFGFTHSVHADGMVFGGYTWRKGSPVIGGRQAR